MVILESRVLLPCDFDIPWELLGTRQRDSGKLMFAFKRFWHERDKHICPHLLVRTKHMVVSCKKYLGNVVQWLIVLNLPVGGGIILADTSYLLH